LDGWCRHCPPGAIRRVPTLGEGKRMIHRYEVRRRNYTYRGHKVSVVLYQSDPDPATPGHRKWYDFIVDNREIITANAQNEAEALARAEEYLDHRYPG
jgi:hypothetical protein